MKTVRSSDSANPYNYRQHTVTDFLALMSEAKPAPAAGSAAASAAALAAALTAKAAKLSTRHLKNAHELDNSATALRDRAMELCELDASLYAQVIEAQRLQRKVDEPSTGTQMVSSALERANQVPIELAEVAAEIGGIAVTVAESGNPNLIGDCVCAALLAQTVVRTAVMLTEVNVPDSRHQPPADRLQELTVMASKHVSSALGALNRIDPIRNQQS